MSELDHAYQTGLMLLGGTAVAAFILAKLVNGAKGTRRHPKPTGAQRRQMKQTARLYQR